MTVSRDTVTCQRLDVSFVLKKVTLGTGHYLSPGGGSEYLGGDHMVF